MEGNSSHPENIVDHDIAITKSPINDLEAVILRFLIPSDMCTNISNIFVKNHQIMEFLLLIVLPSHWNSSR